MGREKGLPLQLGQQGAQFAIELNGAAILQKEKHMVDPQLQAEKPGEGNGPLYPVLPDSEPGGAVPLQLHQTQQV